MSVSITYRKCRRRLFVLSIDHRMITSRYVIDLVLDIPTEDRGGSGERGHDEPGGGGRHRRVGVEPRAGDRRGRRRQRAGGRCGRINRAARPALTRQCRLGGPPSSSAPRRGQALVRGGSTGAPRLPLTTGERWRPTVPRHFVAT